MFNFNFFRLLFHRKPRTTRNTRSRGAHQRASLGVETLETRLMMAANLGGSFNFTPAEAPLGTIASAAPMAASQLPQPLPPKVSLDPQAVDSLMQGMSSPADLVSLNPQPLPP